MTNTDTLLKNIDSYAESEHLAAGVQSYQKDDPRIVGAALEIAERSKSILGGLYYDFRKTGGGFSRKVKNMVIQKLANIVRNTVERPFLTQQKYNEQIYYLVKLLVEENQSLRKEMAELKSNRQLQKQ
jgi:hypothetical protein